MSYGGARRPAIPKLADARLSPHPRWARQSGSWVPASVGSSVPRIPSDALPGRVNWIHNPTHTNRMPNSVRRTTQIHSPQVYATTAKMNDSTAKRKTDPRSGPRAYSTAWLATSEEARTGARGKLVTEEARTLLGLEVPRSGAGPHPQRLVGPRCREFFLPLRGGGQSHSLGRRLLSPNRIGASPRSTSSVFPPCPLSRKPVFDHRRPSVSARVPGPTCWKNIAKQMDRARSVRPSSEKCRLSTASQVNG